MNTTLLIILILLLVLLLPTWPHSRNLGPWPGGILGIILLVFLILLITGRI